MSKTIAQEAKDILSPIPEDKWITHLFTDEIDSCCGMGHYNRHVNGRPHLYWNSNCNHSEKDDDLRRESRKFLNGKGDIASVNNGNVPAYPQPTPYARVMALLNDMIEAGY